MLRGPDGECIPLPRIQPPPPPPPPPPQPKTVTALAGEIAQKLPTGTPPTAAQMKAAVTAVQQAHQKKGDYDEAALAQATVLVESQYPATPTAKTPAPKTPTDPIDAAVAKAKQDGLGGLFSTGNALDQAGAALKAPKPHDVSKTDASNTNEAYQAYLAHPNDPTAVRNFHEALAKEMQDQGITTPMLSNMLYYQDYFDQAELSVLTGEVDVLTSSGNQSWIQAFETDTQAGFQTFGTNIEAGLIVSQAQAAAGANGTDYVNAFQSLSQNLAGLPTNSPVYQSVMADPTTKGLMTGATQQILQQSGANGILVCAADDKQTLTPAGVLRNMMVKLKLYQTPNGSPDLYNQLLNSVVDAPQTRTMVTLAAGGDPLAANNPDPIHTAATVLSPLAAAPDFANALFQTYFAGDGKTTGVLAEITNYDKSGDAVSNDAASGYYGGLMQIYSAIGAHGTAGGLSILNTLSARLKGAPVHTLVDNKWNMGVDLACKAGAPPALLQEMLNGYWTVGSDGTPKLVPGSLDMSQGTPVDMGSLNGYDDVEYINPGMGVVVQQESGIPLQAPSQKPPTGANDTALLAGPQVLDNLQIYSSPKQVTATIAQALGVQPDANGNYNLNTKVFGDTTLGQVVNQIQSIGGADVVMACLPLEFQKQGDNNKPQQLAVFEVQNAETGQMWYVGPNAHAEADWSSWVDHNGLGDGQLSYLNGGHETFGLDGNLVQDTGSHVNVHHNSVWQNVEVGLTVAAAVGSMVLTDGADAPLAGWAIAAAIGGDACEAYLTASAIKGTIDSAQALMSRGPDGQMGYDHWQNWLALGSNGFGAVAGLGGFTGRMATLAGRFSSDGSALDTLASRTSTLSQKLITRNHFVIAPTLLLNGTSLVTEGGQIGWELMHGQPVSASEVENFVISAGLSGLAVAHGLSKGGTEGNSGEANGSDGGAGGTDPNVGPLPTTSPDSSGGDPQPDTTGATATAGITNATTTAGTDTTGTTSPPPAGGTPPVGTPNPTVPSPTGSQPGNGRQPDTTTVSTDDALTEAVALPNIAHASSGSSHDGQSQAQQAAYRASSDPASAASSADDSLDTRTTVTVRKGAGDALRGPDAFAAVQPAVAGADTVRLVIGGGRAYRAPDRGAGEVFLDINPAVRPDLVADVRNMTPVPDSSVGEIYAENVNQDVFRSEAFNEAKRVLQPGGLMVLDLGGDGIAARDAIQHDLESLGFTDVSVRFVGPAGEMPADDPELGWTRVTARAPGGADTTPEPLSVPVYNAVPADGLTAQPGWQAAHPTVAAYEAAPGTTVTMVRLSDVTGQSPDEAARVSTLGGVVTKPAGRDAYLVQDPSIPPGSPYAPHYLSMVLANPETGLPEGYALLHPQNGLAAAGVTPKGRVVWPVAGAAGSADDAAAQELQIYTSLPKPTPEQANLVQGVLDELKARYGDYLQIPANLTDNVRFVSDDVFAALPFEPPPTAGGFTARLASGGNFIVIRESAATNEGIIQTARQITGTPEGVEIQSAWTARSLVAHELLHALTAPAFNRASQDLAAAMTQLGKPALQLHEGITELLAWRNFGNRPPLPTDTQFFHITALNTLRSNFEGRPGIVQASYPSHVAAAEYLIQEVGTKTVYKAYFEGDPQAVDRIMASPVAGAFLNFHQLINPGETGSAGTSGLEARMTVSGGGPGSGPGNTGLPTRSTITVEPRSATAPPDRLLVGPEHYQHLVDAAQSGQLPQGTRVYVYDLTTGKVRPDLKGLLVANAVVAPGGGITVERSGGQPQTLDDYFGNQAPGTDIRFVVSNERVGIVAKRSGALRDRNADGSLGQTRFTTYDPAATPFTTAAASARGQTAPTAPQPPATTAPTPSSSSAPAAPPVTSTPPAAPVTSTPVTSTAAKSTAPTAPAPTSQPPASTTAPAVSSTAAAQPTATTSRVSVKTVALPDTRMRQTEQKPGGPRPGNLYRDVDGQYGDAQGMLLYKNMLDMSAPNPSVDQSEYATNNAVTTSALYRAALGDGAAAKLLPATYTPSRGTGVLGQTSAYGVASVWVDDLKFGDSETTSALTSPALSRQNGVFRAAAMHILTQNDDPVGDELDNIGLDQNGMAYHVDLDSGLGVNKDGHQKGFIPFHTVDDVQAAVDKLKTDPQTSAVFGGMTDQDLVASFDVLLARKDALLPQFEEIVNALGPGNDHDKTYLIQTLRQNFDTMGAWRDQLAAGTMADPAARVPDRLADTFAPERPQAKWRGGVAPWYKQPQVSTGRGQALAQFFSHRLVNRSLLAVQRRFHVAAERLPGIEGSTRIDPDTTADRATLAPDPAKVLTSLPGGKVKSLDEVFGKGGKPGDQFVFLRTSSQPSEVFENPVQPSDYTLYNPADGTGNLYRAADFGALQQAARDGSLGRREHVYVYENPDFRNAPPSGELSRPRGHLAANRKGDLAWHGQAHLKPAQKVRRAAAAATLVGGTAGASILLDGTRVLTDDKWLPPAASTVRYSLNLLRLQPRLRDQMLAELKSGDLRNALDIVNNYHRSAIRVASRLGVPEADRTAAEGHTATILGLMEQARHAHDQVPSGSGAKAAHGAITDQAKTDIDAYLAKMDETLGLSASGIDYTHPRTVYGAALRVGAFVTYSISFASTVAKLPAAKTAFTLSGGIATGTSYLISIATTGLEMANARFGRFPFDFGSGAKGVIRWAGRLGSSLFIYSYAEGIATAPPGPGQTALNVLNGIAGSFNLAQLGYDTSLDVRKWLPGNTAQDRVFVYDEAQPDLNGLGKANLKGYFVPGDAGFDWYAYDAGNNRFLDPVSVDRTFFADNAPANGGRPLGDAPQYAVSRTAPKKTGDLPTDGFDAPPASGTALDTTGKPVLFPQAGADDLFDRIDNGELKTPKTIKARPAVVTFLTAGGLIAGAASAVTQLVINIASAMSQSSGNGHHHHLTTPVPKSTTTPAPGTTGNPGHRGAPGQSGHHGGTGNQPGGTAPTQPAKTVKIVSGDTMWSIATQNGDTLAEVLAANPAFDPALLDGNPYTPKPPGDTRRDPDLIFPDDKIQVPEPQPQQPNHTVPHRPRMVS